MLPATMKIWNQQNRHEGDRARLFRSVRDRTDARRVLYPGSWADVATSFVFDEVTYVDLDRRAATFFSDADGVAEIIATNKVDDGGRAFRFIAGNYREPLEVPDASVDLLVSLYAGFISEACTRYLRVGGHLLVNPSHGDAAMASIDRRYELSGAIVARGGDYRVDDRDLDGYLVPKKPQEITAGRLHQLGKGIAYTRSPFAYLFTRVA